MGFFLTAWITPAALFISESNSKYCIEETQTLNFICKSKEAPAVNLESELR